MALGDEFHGEVAIRGPRASEIGDDLDAVRTWVSRMAEGERSGRRYTLEWIDIGGGWTQPHSRSRDRVDLRAGVALLGVTQEVRRLRELLALVDAVPPVRDWVVAHPLRPLSRDCPGRAPPGVCG